jgi:hypothetical protein
MNEQILDQIKATGREYFDNKYNLQFCYANPRAAGIMNIHVFEQIGKTNKLLSEIINLLNKEMKIEREKNESI